MFREKKSIFCSLWIQFLHLCSLGTLAVPPVPVSLYLCQLLKLQDQTDLIHHTTETPGRTGLLFDVPNSLKQMLENGIIKLWHAMCNYSNKWISLSDTKLSED